MPPRQRLAASSSSTDEASEGSEQSFDSSDSKMDNGETIIQTDPDVARDHHDLFNLVALVRHISDFGQSGLDSRVKLHASRVLEFSHLSLLLDSCVNLSCTNSVPWCVQCS